LEGLHIKICGVADLQKWTGLYTRSSKNFDREETFRLCSLLTGYGPAPGGRAGARSAERKLMHDDFKREKKSVLKTGP